MASNIAPRVGYFTGRVNGHSTGGREARPGSNFRAMLRDVLCRIEARLEALKVSATAASRAAGLSEDAIRNIRRAVERNDRQGISTNTIIALAPVLGVTAAWLLEGSEADAPLARIIGTLEADGELAVKFRGDGDTAPIPPGGTPRSVAVEVRGHALRAIAEDGSLIYFEDNRAPPMPESLGYYCLVGLEDGRVLFKRLLRGSQPGVYLLESQVGPPMEEVRVAWAAEPTAIIPARHAQRIIRRTGAPHAA